MSDSTKRLRTAAWVIALATLCTVLGHVLFGFAGSRAEAAGLWVGFALLLALPVVVGERVGLSGIAAWLLPPARPRQGLDEVTVELAPDGMEAEIACGLLRTEGIWCTHRQTDLAGVSLAVGRAGLVGPRAVIVTAKDAARARDLLEPAPIEEDGRRHPS